MSRRLVVAVTIDGDSVRTYGLTSDLTETEARGFLLGIVTSLLEAEVVDDDEPTDSEMQITKTGLSVTS